VVSIRERRLMRTNGNKLAEHADLGKLSPFLNDMVVDRQGRAYVEDFGYDVLEGEPAKPGSIILVHPDGRASVVARDLKSPNGSMVTPDGRLIVGESSANRLVSFPIKPDGTLREMGIHAVLEGAPDGTCLEAEGGTGSPCSIRSASTGC
jgi:sugar lactone lactonase YvrE